jgi:hypothetical protein
LIRIAITAAAFNAVAKTLPVGSFAYEPETTADGGRFIWIDRRARGQLDALRGPGESYSEIILKLAGIEAAKPGRKRGSRTSISFDFP